MLHSGLMILEANLNYRIGSSFDTITKDLLGKGWNLVNGVSIAFVLYILTYAYISASGSILHHTFSEMSLNVPARAAGFGFALLVAFIVWMSTKAVSRMTAIVLGAKVITFFLTFGSLLGHVEPTTLFNVAEKNASYAPYLLMTLPFCGLVWLPRQRAEPDEILRKRSTYHHPLLNLRYAAGAGSVRGLAAGDDGQYPAPAVYRHRAEGRQH